MREIQELVLHADRASRIEHLRKRPENQDYESQLYLRKIEQARFQKVDKIVPWIFREIKKGRLDMDAIFLHPDRFDHIEDWLQEKRPNLMSMTYDDVREGLYQWDLELKQKMEDEAQYEEQNIVYEFGDGWTIQNVRTSDDLETEGDLMGHCVGGYCHSVSSGSSFIYSLRDPKNKPHVTIELKDSSETESPRVVQIKGKQNRTPVEEYKKKVAEWMKTLNRPRWSNDGEPLTVEDLNKGKFISKDGSVDEYGIIETQYEVPDWSDIFEQLKTGPAHRGYHYYYTIADAAVETAVNTGTLPELKKAFEDFQSEAWETVENDILSSDYQFPREPDRDDFETEEEFDSAYAEWERENDSFWDAARAEHYLHQIEEEFYKYLKPFVPEYQSAPETPVSASIQEVLALSKDDVEPTERIPLDTLLTVPDTRQYYDYDCGVSALLSVIGYYGLDVRGEELAEKLRTTPEEGTTPEAIVRVAESFGYQVWSGSMSVEDLKRCLDRGLPVIVDLQAWADDPNVNWAENWDDGHYIVAVGHGDGKIVFEDPSDMADVYLTEEELLERWRDRDADGHHYIRFGIVIVGDKHYSRYKFRHLD